MDLEKYFIFFYYAGSFKIKQKKKPPYNFVCENFCVLKLEWEIKKESIKLFPSTMWNMLKTWHYGMWVEEKKKRIVLVLYHMGLFSEYYSLEAHAG